MADKYDGAVFRVGEWRHTVVQPVRRGRVRFLEILVWGICELWERIYDFLVGLSLEASPFPSAFGGFIGGVVWEVELGEEILAEKVKRRNPAGAEEEGVGGDLIATL